jgi:hypothetical protein
MDPSTLNAYDTRASDFAGRYAAADVSPLHRLLLAHLPTGARLLEIGCGAGRDAVFLAEHGFAVIAADASAAMLDQARNAPGAATTAYPDVSSSSNTTAPRVKTTRSSSPPTSRTAPPPANTPSNATALTRPSGVFSQKTLPTSRSKSPRPPCPIRFWGRLWEGPNQEKL